MQCQLHVESDTLDKKNLRIHPIKIYSMAETIVVVHKAPCVLTSFFFIFTHDGTTKVNARESIMFPDNCWYPLALGAKGVTSPLGLLGDTGSKEYMTAARAH